MNKKITEDMCSGQVISLLKFKNDNGTEYKIIPKQDPMDYNTWIVSIFKNDKEIISKRTSTVGNVKTNKMIFTLRNEYFDTVN